MAPKPFWKAVAPIRAALSILVIAIKFPPLSNALIRYVARSQDGKIIEAITVPLVGKNGLEIIKGEVINFEFTLRIETKNVYDKQLTLDYLQ